MQPVGGWTATACTMLDLQIVPTIPAHINVRKPAMHTRVIKVINRTATASTMDSVQVV